MNMGVHFQRQSKTFGSIDEGGFVAGTQRPVH
jgi:hypothetical protein